MVSILKSGSKSDKIRTLLEGLNKSKSKGIDSSRFSGTIQLKEDIFSMEVINYPLKKWECKEDAVIR